MRGRKPKPLRIQLSEGDTRKKGTGTLKKALESEIKVSRGLPECPEHLVGRARDAWFFWSEELKDMKLDCRPDGPMLEGACVNYARAVQNDLILQHGCQVSEPIMDKEGEQVGEKIRNHPAVAVSNAAWKQVRAFCSDFGLSPVSRTRLALDKSEKSEDLMSLLSAPRERKPSGERLQ